LKSEKEIAIREEGEICGRNDRFLGVLVVFAAYWAAISLPCRGVVRGDDGELRKLFGSFVMW